MIHSTAIIGENTKIAESAKIGAYAIIGSNVVIGENVVVEEHAKICSHSIVENNCRICSFTTIGGDPQDLHFDTATVSGAIIGENSVIREGSTVHRATKPNEFTRIGKNCLFMANSHVAHDCQISDNVIIACFAAIGGHAKIGKNTFVSGGVMVHQNCKIGEGAMLSGNSAFSENVPPYVNGTLRNTVRGLNLIGLMRRGCPRAAIANLKELYTFIFVKSKSIKANAQEAKKLGMAKTPEGENFLNFILENGERPIAQHGLK